MTLTIKALWNIKVPVLVLSCQQKHGNKGLDILNIIEFSQEINNYEFLKDNWAKKWWH